MRSLQHTELSIGATASLWEAYLTPRCRRSINNARRYSSKPVALRHSLVKQLHERQLDLLITTEPPKMDELASQQLSNFSLRLFSSAHRDKQAPMPYIKLEWGADFHQQESRMLEGDNVPVLTTTSAHLTRQLLETTGGCAFLPSQWEQEYPQLVAATEIPPIIRPCMPSGCKTAINNL